MVRLFLSLVALAFVVTSSGQDPPAAGATGTYAFGEENSWIRVQNIGSSDATVEVSYYDEQGLLAGSDGCPSATCPILFPGSGWTFFQRDNPSLPVGFQGSAVVSTDQPIVALLAKDVFRGTDFAIAGDTLSPGPGAHRIYLPITGKHAGPNSDWNGRFVIQNMSETVLACVTITYISAASDREVGWDPYKPPETGEPELALPGCPNGGWPLAPKGSLFRFPDTMVVPDQFTGSVRIDLHENSSGQGMNQQFIAASADSWNSNTNSFASYRGFAETDLGQEIILPLIDRQVGPENSYSTRFTIVNQSPLRPAVITLQFDGLDLETGAAISMANTFTVAGSRQCFQDLDFADCLAEPDNLPFNFVGTARLSSTEPLGVVVDRGTSINDTFTNYRGVRLEDAAYEILLPVLNKNFGPVEGVGNGWNSWFRVMVADGGQANVLVTYFGLDLPGGSVSYRVLVNREFTVFQHLEAMLPDGFAGTAIIEADRPIVALANLYTDIFQGDPDLLYNGIPLK